MNLYIFAIGGTGSRVLRSFINLLATGVQLPNITSVIPILIDTDARNGDKEIISDIIRSYIDTRNEIYTNDTEKQEASFFKTEVKYFKEITRNNERVGSNEAFNDLTSEQTFIEWLNDGSNEFDAKHRNLLNLLYDDNSSEGREELRLSIKKGYKGNPNIGSVVFNRINGHPDFTTFLQMFNPNDKIFIISSIFGGNGSSGFPTLIKLLRRIENDNTLNSHIGALTVLPYYDVAKRGDGSADAVKSNLFDLKAKSALDFYKDDEKMRTINALFLLADKDKRGAFEYHDGEAEQKNTASIIECFGASSIIRFCQLTDTELRECKTYGFGLSMEQESNRGGDEILTIRNFIQQRFFHTTIIPPLLKFIYGYQYYLYCKNEGNRNLSAINVRNTRERLSTLIAANTSKYDNYYNNFFRTWLTELSSDQPAGRRRLKLINIEAPSRFRELIYLLSISDRTRNTDIEQKFFDVFQATNQAHAYLFSLIKTLSEVGNFIYNDISNYQTLN